MERPEGGAAGQGGAARQLVVRFHTSSIEKFLQARIVFQRRGLNLKYFRESQDPYQEEYKRGRRALLRMALDEIRTRIGANSLFFVEDTSLKIDALSREGRAVPGLRVKEWFRDTTFEALDAELRRQGNQRDATVYSDIGLYVPRLGRTVFVRGETSGRVAEVPPDFEMSYKFPWLTPGTFNGWFVPRGSGKTLGEMDFEESLRYDFRVRSVTRLLDRIEEYAAVVNLPTQAYSVRRARVVGQQLLFSGMSPLILVVGRVCAGKTTFGEYVESTHGWLHVEASDEMNGLAQEEAGARATGAFERAKNLLERRGADCVARRIACKYHDRLESGVVVTGFRAIEEVMYFRNRYPSCAVVYIDAGDRVRFSRHLERGRLDDVRTLRDFRMHDQEQWRLGLLARARDVVDVPRDIADIEIENELGLEDYYGQIDSVVDGLSVAAGGGVGSGEFGVVRGVSRVNGGLVRGRRAFRCLSTLKEFGGAATCAEVRGRMDEGKGGDMMSVRHINWVLSRVPELVERTGSGGRLRYRILSAGRAYVEAVGGACVGERWEGRGGRGLGRGSRGGFLPVGRGLLGGVPAG